MCSCSNVTYYRESERHCFDRASEHIGLRSLTIKRVKCHIKSVSFHWPHPPVVSWLYTILLKEKNELRYTFKNLFWQNVTSQNLIETFIVIHHSFLIDCSVNLYLLFKIYLYELIIHLILITYCQFLIVIYCNFNFFW